MPGFTCATGAMRYEPGRGFGWGASEGMRSGSFRVDLPNGRYHVIMNIDSPNGYGGDVSAYRNRRVLSNGRPEAAKAAGFASADDFLEVT